MEYPRPPIGPANASRHVAAGDSHGNHVSDGVVAARQRDEAPYSERDCIEHRRDLIAYLPAPGLIGSQGGVALFILLHVHCTDCAGHDEKRQAWPEQMVS